MESIRSRKEVGRNALSTSASADTIGTDEAYVDSPDKTVGASLRQNGKHLLITRTVLEHQRRQIINARSRAAFTLKYGRPVVRVYTGGKGLERQLER